MKYVKYIKITCSNIKLQSFYVSTILSPMQILTCLLLIATVDIMYLDFAKESCGLDRVVQVTAQGHKWIAKELVGQNGANHDHPTLPN